MDKLKLAAITFTASVAFILASMVVNSGHYTLSVILFSIGLFGIQVSIFFPLIDEFTKPILLPGHSRPSQNIEYNIQNTQKIEYHTHNYRHNKFSEGVEVREDRPDGSAITTRHIKKWE